MERPDFLWLFSWLRFAQNTRPTKQQMNIKTTTNGKRFRALENKQRNDHRPENVHQQVFNDGRSDLRLVQQTHEQPQREQVVCADRTLRATRKPHHTFNVQLTMPVLTI